LRSIDYRSPVFNHTIPRPAPPSTAGRRRASKIIASAIAILLAGILLYFSLQGIQWVQVWRLISRANPAYLGALGLLGTTGLMLRALRWRILLRAGGEVGVATVFWATCVGYFGNNFLPARAGELARTLLISSRSGMSSAYALTTALMERMADAIALVIISALALWTLPAPPDWLAKASKPFGIAAACGLLGIGILPRLERFGHLVLGRMPLLPGLREKLIRVVGQVFEGLRSFHDASRLLRFLALTIVIWCIDATGTMVCAGALGLVIPLPVAFLLNAGLGLGSALPSTPGYVGIYQFVAVGVLVPFGFTRSAAIAYILAAQAVSYVVIGMWGSLGLIACRRRADRGASGRPVQQTSF
jgi:uncharacterized protein (TIRG00374 family)